MGGFSLACSLQLDLALDAGVSQRHLSFLESGRSRPSRDMILQLAEVLDIPLRERNLLLQNWAQVATLLLSRLQREVAADPTHEALNQLFEDLCRLPGVPNQWRSHTWLDTPPPILPLEINLGAQALKVFTMISTFGTALDITAEELRVETFFPADAFSTGFFRMLAQQA